VKSQSCQRMCDEVSRATADGYCFKDVGGLVVIPYSHPLLSVEDSTLGPGCS